METDQLFNLVHPYFSIEGSRIDETGLKKIAFSYIKEGEDFEKEIGLFLLDWLSKRATVTVRTSGTTGEPKDMEVAKAAMFASAKATADYFNLGPSVKVLHCLPCQYIAGKMMLVRAMVLGLNIKFVNPSSTPLSGVKDEIGFCAMVPMQVEASLDKIKLVRQLIIGGAPLVHELEEKIIDHIDPEVNRVYQTFGMTETLSHIAIRPIIKDALGINTFMTVKGIKISTDERGCLVVTAPQLFSEPLITNDLVKINHDFSFSWLGRIDNLVNSGGVKIIPENVEKKIKSTVEGDFFLMGMPDQQLGEKLVLIVNKVQPNDLLDQLARIDGMEKYQVPKEVLVVDDFVYTSNGKLRRSKTMNRFFSKM